MSETTSVWEALRKQHGEVAEDKDPLYLDDPMHDGVVYRYRYVPAQQMKKPAKRLAKIADPVSLRIAVAIEQLVSSLDGIMVLSPNGEIPKDAEGRELYPEPLIELADDGEAPIRFDERLSKGMGFPADTETHVRKIVRAMFKGNDYALIEHAEEVSEWTSQVGTAVREEFEEELEKGR
jgi:hypothetical protein